MIAAVIAAVLAPACADDEGGAPEEVVARIDAPDGELLLERAVVDELVETRGMSEAEAQAHGLATLRLVAARRAELAERPTPPEHPDDLDPARRRFLERAALSRLWLREIFEPAHEAEDIPEAVVERNLADPRVSQRLFHPDVWLVCQALIVPAERVDGRHVMVPGAGESDPDPEAAAAWRAAAREAFTPLVDRVHRLEPDLLAATGDDPDAREGDCELLARIVGASEQKLPGPEGTGDFRVRFERFAFAPSTVTGFDPTWVEAVTKLDGPGLLGPFPTRFGLHLVMLAEIQPALLADGSRPPDELRAARKAKLREEMRDSWRAEQLRETLAEERERRVVRLAPELEGEP